MESAAKKPMTVAMEMTTSCHEWEYHCGRPYRLNYTTRGSRKEGGHPTLLAAGREEGRGPNGGGRGTERALARSFEMKPMLR
jgi:hypothetical protein